MEDFFQSVALVLLAVIAVLTLQGAGKGIAQMLSLLVCAMVLAVAARYLRPVLDFAKKLRAVSALDSDVLTILLKAVGISVTAEITTMLCEDSGNGAMGKTVQFLATALVICLSLPLLTALLDLMEEMVNRL